MKLVIILPFFICTLCIENKKIVNISCANLTSVVSLSQQLLSKSLSYNLYSVLL